MNPLHPYYFRRTLYGLRGGFLIRPLAISLALGAMGGVLPRIEFNPYVSKVLYATPIVVFKEIQPNLAISILSSIAAGVMTVVSIVFAILLMSLTLASMQFSPRILIGFTKDRVTQWTLGVFLGTFSYCVCALPSVRYYSNSFVPVFTVEGAMALALVAVVWLIFFIHHIAHSISVNYIVDRIASETETTINDVAPRRQGADRFLPDFPVDEDLIAVPSDASGYVRTIDFDQLLRLCERFDCRVSICRRVGHFIPQDVTILNVACPKGLPPNAGQLLLDTVEIGPTRSLEQDIEFGILQIVDIALRAISPAVNDPSTAISCVDQLGRILIRYAKNIPETGVLFDSKGVARIVVSAQGLERMVHSAFDQIRSYSKGDIAVSLRMLRALSDLASTLDDRDTRGMLATMGQRILAGSEAVLAEDELGEIRKRQDDLERLAEQGSP